MNASTRREVSKIEAYARLDPRTAAATLAAIHRASNASTQAQLLALVSALGLSGYLEIINGCLVPTIY